MRTPWKTPILTTQPLVASGMTPLMMAPRMPPLMMAAHAQMEEALEELDEDQFHHDDAHRDDRSSLLCDGSLDDRYQLVM